MVNTRWTVGLAILALTIFGASDARALTAYVAEGTDACRSSRGKSCCAHDSGPDHQVGAFGLAGVEKDKESGHVCSTKIGGCASHGKVCPLSSVGTGLAQIVSGPFILTGAILDDAHRILTMPYQKAEPIS